MIIRFFLLSAVVAGFVLLAYAILGRTRHLERRPLEDGLLVLEIEAGERAPGQGRRRGG